MSCFERIPVKRGRANHTVNSSQPLRLDPATGGLKVSLEGGVRTTPAGELVGSQRVSLYNSESAYGYSALRDAKTETGTGTVTDDDGEFILSTGVTAGGVAALESKRRGVYVAGFPLECGVGVRFGDTLAGTAQALWGYYDANNGFGWGVDADGVFVFVRRAGATTKTHQTSWSLDKLNGRGSSGATLDLTAGVICELSFTFYGYGTIEWGFLVVVDGRRVYVPAHRETPSGATSIVAPNQPVRAEIQNGDQATDYKIYVGGRQITKFGSTGATTRTHAASVLAVATNTSYAPIISLRKKATFNGRPNTVNVRLASIEIYAADPTAYRVTYGGTLTGASFAGPSGVSATEVAAEIDTTASANNIAAGLVIGGGFVATSSRATGGDSLTQFDSFLGASDVITIEARTISSTSTASVYVTWSEDW
jgi:hypothetical protein